MTKEAISVDEFCRSHDLSRATFYALQKAHQGPRIMKVGRRTLITIDAAREWREKLEQQCSAQAA